MGKYLQEKKFIRNFIKYWGTTTVKDSSGKDVEVLLPYNYIWTDDGHELHKFPYSKGCNTLKEGTLNKAEPVLKSQ